MNYENKFKDWLENDPNHKYSKDTISGYIGALRSAGDWFGVKLTKPLLEIGEIDELQKNLRIIMNIPEYDDINMNHGHGEFSTSVTAYKKFLNSMYDFAWIPFYTEFADKLLEYKDNRKKLVDKLVAVFQAINIKFPKMESEGLPTDMDPFTVFGLFNKGISDANRRLIIKGLAEEFDIRAEQPKSFPGIPLLNNLSAAFFLFREERGDDDVNKLWSLFESAIKLAGVDNENNRADFRTKFEAVRELKGIRWNITMAMFWIRPYYFINLDSRNRWFITNAKNTTDEYASALPKFDKVPDGAEYLKICDASKKLVELEELPYSSIPELSAYAWSISKEDDAHDEEEPRSSSGNDSLADGDVKKTRYWMYTVFDDESWAECQSKGIMTIGVDLIGDYTRYGSKEEIRQALVEKYAGDSSRKNQALMAWNFSRTIKPGDIIFAKRANTMVGRGIVTGEYVFDDTRPDYKSIRKVNWTNIGQWEHPGKAVAKRLTDITPYTDYVEKLNALFDDTAEETPEEPEKDYPAYTEKDFLRDVYMSADNYHTLVNVLLKKKNIILQGAPGVGKTYAAKRLAYSVMGKKDQDRVMMIQFHQSYSYEDFIEGYRPAAEGFSIKKGAFYKFCKKAQEDDENPYFFIIDEINRGNLSKIFGELFMLIETDKRGVELQLLYSDEKFSVPANVHIIGMMNTADRSLAMLDYALRRRFSFIDMKPAFDTDGFVQYRDGLANDKFNALISCVRQLNNQIRDDAALGEGFCIGHSYFCNLKPDTVSDKELSSIVEFELIPLLREYWFDEADKAADWSARLRGAVK